VILSLNRMAESLLGADAHSFPILKFAAGDFIRAYNQFVGKLEHKQLCPICKTEVRLNWRYPKRLCSHCSSKAIDEKGQQLLFYNTSITGGFEARVIKTGEVRTNHLCFISGIACFADEARFGGIVIQLHSDSSSDELIRSGIYMVRLRNKELMPVTLDKRYVDFCARVNLKNLKIGKANNLSHRMSEYLSIFGVEHAIFEPIAFTTDTQRAETAILRALKEYRMRSPKGGKLEWLAGIEFHLAKQIALEALNTTEIDFQRIPLNKHTQ